MIKLKSTPLINIQTPLYFVLIKYMLVIISLLVERTRLLSLLLLRSRVDFLTFVLLSL